MNRSTTLSIIRVAMLAGVVILGAVALYISKGGIVDPLAEDVLAALRMAFIAVLAGTAIAMFFFRKQRLALGPDDDPTTLNIVGWAIGEATALFGAVILLLSGEITYFLVGVVMMLVSFVFFPVPHE